MTPLVLGDLFELKYGKSLGKDTRAEGSIPVFGSNGQVDIHDQSLVDYPTIIVGRKGSIGEVHLVKTPCWPIDTTYFVEALNEHKFDLDWLYRLLRTLRLQELNRSAAIPGLNREDVYRIPVLLPPIDDQIRIAHLLGKVEGLIAQRKKHLQQLDDLLKSVFLEMFGPRSSGYADWPLVEVKDLATTHKGAMRTGPFGSNLLHSEFTADGDVAVLGIDNAVQNHFSWDKRRFITNEKYRGLETYRIFPGDVIVTIMGTIGRSAVVPENIPLAINTKHLAAITLNRELANPLFLSYSIHSSPFILNQFKSKNRGAIMSGLNLGLIKETKLKRPPIALQNKFAETHMRVDDLRSMYRQSIADLETLYGALSQQAFKGELDLSRVPIRNMPTEIAHSAAGTPLPAPAIAPIDNELLLSALESRDSRKELLQQRLEAYRQELGGSTFSLKHFGIAVKTRLTDELQRQLDDVTADPDLRNRLTVLHPTNEFVLDAIDYDQIKAWVFQALDSGTLTQSFDEERNLIELKAAQR